MATGLEPSLKNLSVLDEFKFAAKKPGEEGRKVKVLANFSPITINKNAVVYQYNIQISMPDKIDSKADSNVPQKNRINRQRRIVKGSNFEIFKKFFEQNKSTLFSNPDGSSMAEPVFDGRKIFLTLHPIKLNNGTKGVYTIKAKVPEKKFPQTFEIQIFTPSDAHLIDLTRLNNLRNIRQAEIELQALDLIISYGAKQFNLFLDSKIFVKKDDLITRPREEQDRIRFHLGELKEASFGHYLSAKLTENGTQLNVDRTSMVFFKGGPLIKLLEEFCTEMRNQRGNRGGGFNNRGGGNFNQRGRGAGNFNQRGRGVGNFNQRGLGRGAGNFNQRNGDQLDRVVIDESFRFNDNELRILNAELKGLAFKVDHFDSSLKYTISQLSTKTSREQKFEETMSNGQKRMVSVQDYYKEKYRAYFESKRININGHLPCVQVGSKYNINYFPFEVVKIIEDQYYTKKLSPNLQSTMTTGCAVQPTIRFDENEKQITNLIQSSSKCETDFLRSYGINLNNRFKLINARYLDQPSILGNNDRRKDLKEGQWRDNSYIIPSKIVNSDFNWLVVNVTELKERKTRSVPEKLVLDLISNVVKAANDSGLRLQETKNIRFEEYNGRNLKKEMIKAFQEYTTNFKNLKFILFIIPDDDELYSLIKYLSELNEMKHGIVTQCVDVNKSSKFGDHSYCNNLMLKINSKLGGSNCYLARDSKVGFLSKKTMIMGLDVTHPSKHDRLGNSIASIVGTYEPTFVNYHSKCVVQPKPRLEIVQLDDVTEELLHNFKSKNEKDGYPKFILVYRDGVSEGQFVEVVDQEIRLMKKAFEKISKKIGQEYNPKVTFIVVQKRHHTRFLPVKDEDKLAVRGLRPNQKANHNAKPGLVVDTEIVSNYYFDFYLSAHRGELGTTRPSRYIVLHNETKFSGDEIQKTTYYLSHLFTRCTKVVSVPPPVLYAHLAAKRARSYLKILDNNRGQVFGENELNPEEVRKLNKRIEVSPQLQNTLYFI